MWWRHNLVQQIIRAYEEYDVAASRCIRKGTVETRRMARGRVKEETKDEAARVEAKEFAPARHHDDGDGGGPRIMPRFIIRAGHGREARARGGPPPGTRRQVR